MGLITLKDGALSCRWISGNRHISRRWHTQFQLNTSLRHYLVRTIVPQDTAKRALSSPAPYYAALHPTVRNHPPWRVSEMQFVQLSGISSREFWGLEHSRMETNITFLNQKGTVALCMPRRHILYGEYRYVLSWALEANEWSPSYPARFIPEERTLGTRWVRGRMDLNVLKKKISLATTGNETTFYSPYCNWAIRAPWRNMCK